MGEMQVLTVDFEEYTGTANTNVVWTELARWKCTNVRGWNIRRLKAGAKRMTIFIQEGTPLQIVAGSVRLGSMDTNFKFDSMAMETDLATVGTLAQQMDQDLKLNVDRGIHIKFGEFATIWAKCAVSTPANNTFEIPVEVL